MTTDRRQEIERLFNAACERATGERNAFLDGACRDDSELRREVEALLAQRRSGPFVEQPTVEHVTVVPPLVRDTLAPGEQVGHYTILSRLGAGGMGEVYLALDTRLGLKVALKIPGKGFVKDPERLHRFRLEARAAAALANPHILTVYDIGEADSLHYIATEYIEGETLRQRLKRGPMTIRDAVDVATQVASALHASHSAGVVHRDIKPENLMLQRDGLLKILDFGIAKLLEPTPSSGPEATLDLLKTAPGTMMGTASYVSPEQAQGLEVDERTDLWSVGVVLYEMVTGRRPFVGPTAHHILISVMDREPESLRQGGRDVPEELERVIALALAKNPNFRYQRAVELFADLRRVSAAVAESQADADIHVTWGDEKVPTDTSHPALTRSSGIRAAPNNLPFPLTSFVGRDRQIAAVRDRLAASRLVTLCGPGGIGKTRLAIEVARALSMDGSEGIWLVELGALLDPSLIPSALAQALGVREQSGVALLETIGRSLSSGQSLVVLDNCEHLVEECARIVEGLLRASAGVRVLATSREPLGIRGEVVVNVPTLTVPESGGGLDAERLGEYEATKLFLDRAALSRPGFAMTERNARVVADLCRRLDGIPLAIEFAAARLKALTVEQVLAKVDDRFRLLTGGGRTASPRHQTLRSAIDWSHDLLSDEERVLLRRLSVFAGGWTLEAAEAATSKDEGTSLAMKDESEAKDEGGSVNDEFRTPSSLHPFDVLQHLERLVDASFVVAEHRKEHVRYGMLETVHEYAAEKLRESGEASAMRARHLDWCLSLAERAEPQLLGHEQGEWLGRLEEERDNLNAALRSVTGEAGDADAAMRLCCALGRFWSLHAHVSEGRSWIERVLTTAPDPSHLLWARTLYWAGHLACRQGDMQIARAHQEKSLALSRALGDTLGCAMALHELFAASFYDRDLDRARPFAEEALALFREAGNLRGVGLGYIALGNIAVEQGDDEQAALWYEEGLAISRRLGDKRAVVANLNNLGQIATRHGEFERGRVFLEEGFEIARELGDTLVKGFLAHTLANLLWRSGDLKGARRVYGESLLARRELGFGRHIADILEEMAALAILEGAPRRAAVLAGAADAVRGMFGADIVPDEQADVEHVLDEARRALSDAEVDRALAEGRALTTDEAVAYALGESRDSLSPGCGQYPER